MFVIVIFITGLAAGAGSEKTNEAIDKFLSKGKEITQITKTKAVEIKDSTKAELNKIKNKVKK